MKRIPFSVDRNGPANLPEQVAAGFRAAIRSGFYKPGDVLPSRGEIADALEISERIPREAMRILAAESLVRPGRGIGCVVLSQKERLWKGRVLIVERMKCAGSYSVSVIAEEIRSRLMRSGYLYTFIGVEVKHNGRSLDVRPVEDALRMPTDFVFAIFPTPNLVRCLRKWGPFLCLGDACDEKDAVVIPWKEPRMELIARCRRCGIRRVLFSAYGHYDEELSMFRAAGFDVESIPVWPKDGFGFLEATERGAFKAFRRRFSSGSGFPDLIYFGDDYVARGGLMALMSLGVKVPEDVRVVTLANRGFVPSFPVTLARIEYNPVAAGTFIADSIIAKIEGRGEVRKPMCYRYVPGESFPE